VYKCFDIFIYIWTIGSMMKRPDLALRMGGVAVLLVGVLLIIIVGDLFSISPVEVPERARDLSANAGFGLLLIGLFAVFLYSSRAFPEEYTEAFLITEGQNMGRYLSSLNLEGNGIYMPARGRLTAERVFVPLEKKEMEVPPVADGTVFNSGALGPSLGVSLIPPGKGLVDVVDSNSSSNFADHSISEGTEAMEKLGKGTGMFGRISLRDRGGVLELRITHTRFRGLCDQLWEEYGDLHRQVGCPACSAVLCAAARLVKSDLRILDAKREEREVIYELRRGSD